MTKKKIREIIGHKGGWFTVLFKNGFIITAIWTWNEKFRQLHGAHWWYRPEKIESIIPAQKGKQLSAESARQLRWATIRAASNAGGAEE